MVTLMLALYTATAAPTVGTCVAADNPYANAGSCPAIWVWDSGTATLNFDLNGACPSGVVEAFVTDPLTSASYTHVFFGQCAGGGVACCTIDDAASEIETLELFGSSSSELLGFSYCPAGMPSLPIATPYPTCTSGSWLTLTVKGATVLKGRGGNDTIIGAHITDYSIDTLEGNGGTDDIHGMDGDDLIRGGGANDRIWGEAGNDTLYGGDDRDELYAGTGNDTLYGGDGDDFRLVGDEGDDRIYGGPGEDILSGYDDNDVLDGGPGFDVLEGDAGDDVLCDTTDQDLLKGGPGNDKLWYDEDAASNQPDPLTTGGLDNSVLPRDSCGKSLYADCETLLVTKPAECTP